MIVSPILAHARSWLPCCVVFTPETRAAAQYSGKVPRTAFLVLESTCSERQGEKLGAGFVDYSLHIKNAEVERFQAEVADREHREYFEMF